MNESFETEYLIKSFISFIPNGRRTVGICLFLLLALLFVFIALKLNNLCEGIVSFRGIVYSKKKKMKTAFMTEGFDHYSRKHSI